LRKTFALLFFQLLLKTKGFKLLVKKSGNAALNILDVLMVVIIHLANTREDAFFLLSRAERSEPVDLGSIDLALLLKIGL
jgi:hypothetical protein